MSKFISDTGFSHPSYGSSLASTVYSLALLPSQSEGSERSTTSAAVRPKIYKAQIYWRTKITNLMILMRDIISKTAPSQPQNARSKTRPLSHSFCNIAAHTG
jgi:hypothetical protein